jgi:penicillin-binding protein 1C
MRLSIDLGLQRYIEAAIAGNVSRYYASRLSNGAAIVINNETGEILAWVGSADFNNAEAAGQIDGVLALNQPGSSMKPFLYAMALENGFLPTMVIADVPMSFGESELYLPRNFNNRFNGPMLFRASLASSLNIPAVYLLYRLGVQNYSQRLFSLGFESLKNSAEDAGLGLALGNAPVSLEELVRAFSVFPRDGVYLPLTAEQLDDDRITERQASAVRIFSADTARLICSFLSDSGARVLAFGSGANFRTPFPVIFKTGTANQYQSIVALGATPLYSAGVWMGNFTGETVIGRTGSSIPAAIVRDTLVVLQGPSGSANSPNFSEPEGWRLHKVCALSGMTPSDACLSVISEYVRPGEESEPCTWHKTVNGRSEVVYPAEYQAWFTSAARQGSLDYGSRPLEILNPRDGFEYLGSPGIGRDEIPVEVIGGGEDQLLVTFNNRTFTVSRPFVFYLDRAPGLHTLRVQCGDEEETVTFTVNN